MGTPAPGTPDPGKYALSAPFARLLAEFTFEVDTDTDQVLVVHEQCLGNVRALDLGGSDDMARLVQSVIDHDC